AALARNRHETSVAALADFHAALAQAAQLTTQLGEMQHRRDMALARRVTANADNDRARAAVEMAEAEEREHRALLARLDAALRAREAAERLRQLREQLDKAEKARTSVEDGAAALAVLV